MKANVMISQTAEYALRAVAHLAMNNDTPQTAQQIATAAQVPLPYLSKILQMLGRVGLIHSQRGPNGGCMLQKDPLELSVYEVVQAVDPLKRILTCPLGLDAHGTNLCPLHKRLDAAMAQVEQSFRESTIGDLIQEPTTSRPLCPFPVSSTAAAAEPDLSVPAATQA